MPRRPRTAAAGLLIFALAATLAGCSDTTRIPDPTPEATADPLFASDEEALAAAVEVYERYLAVSSQILQEGGANPERLEPLVAPDVYAEELETFNEFASAGQRAIGANELVGSDLQQRVPDMDGATEEVISYMCISRANTDVVDADGNSIVPPNAPDRYVFEVVTVHDRESARIESRTLWDGFEACDS